MENKQIRQESYDVVHRAWKDCGLTEDASLNKEAGANFVHALFSQNVIPFLTLELRPGSKFFKGGDNFTLDYFIDNTQGIIRVLN